MKLIYSLIYSLILLTPFAVFGQSQSVRITNSTGTISAQITNSAPAGTEYGLIVWCQNCGSGGSVTANQGTPNTLANAWPVKPTDGTTAITVKPASTLPLATDTAFVVTVRDSVTVTGTVALSGTSAVNQTQVNGVAVSTGNGVVGTGVQRVVIASDQTAYAVSISGNVTVVQATGTNLHVVCDSGCTPGGSFSDSTAFTAGTTAINVSGGVFNDGLADVTSGNAAAPRITAKRAMHINLRDTAGVELEGQKTMAGSVPVVLASDQTAIVVATHAVTQSGTWTVATNADTTISGTVAPAKGLLIIGKTNDGTPQYQPLPLSGGGAAVLVSVSNTVTVTGTVALSGTSAVNVAQIAGTTTLVGNGATGAGSQRVTIASDNTPFPIKIDQTTPGTTNAISLAQIGATTVLTGNGATGAGSQRVTIASDNTAFSVNAAQSGTWNVTVTPSLSGAANNTGTCTSVSTNATVLASFATRKGASIVAKATNTDRVFFKLGATATSSQPPLEPGQSFTLDGTGIYSGQIDAIANSGTQSVCAVEW